MAAVATEPASEQPEQQDGYEATSNTPAYEGCHGNALRGLSDGGSLTGNTGNYRKNRTALSMVRMAPKNA
ncbi:hypothetical protein SVIOM342S_00411 [Streptomyces violaceorubidus]